MMRAANKRGSELARAKTAKLTTVPSRLSRRMGRRPSRSDRLPSTGAASIWLSEYAANKSPIWKGVAPSRSA